MLGLGMPMLPWYPRDFRSSTLGWPMVAKGIYRELLDCQWDMGSLPMDTERLRTIVGATAAEWSEAWPLIESKFTVVEGRRQNLRLEAHRAKSIAKQRSGKLGGLAKASKAGSKTASESGGDQPSENVAPSPSPSPSPYTISGTIDEAGFQKLPTRSNLSAPGKPRAVMVPTRSIDPTKPLTMHATLPKAEWAQWLEFRRRRRWPMDDLTLAKQLKILAPFSREEQIRMIDRSIASGWQGIFPEKGARQLATERKARSTEEILAAEALGVAR
jgi:uncharacterized protein YdaU (DUF1376 family)